MKTIRELINLIETAQPMTHNNLILQLAQQAGILFDTETVPETGLKYEGAMISREDLEQFAWLLINACAEQVDDYWSELDHRFADKRIKQLFGL